MFKNNQAMEKITSRMIKSMGLLIFFIININNSFSQDFFKEVKLLFYEEIVSLPIEIYIPKHNTGNLNFEYVYMQDTLFCTANCISDTTHFKEGTMMISECRINVLNKFKHKKASITANLPSEYGEIKVLIINSQETMFYFELDKKKHNVFHLYNVVPSKK